MLGGAVLYVVLLFFVTEGSSDGIAYATYTMHVSIDGHSLNLPSEKNKHRLGQILDLHGLVGGLPTFTVSIFQIGLGIEKQDTLSIT